MTVNSIRLTPQVGQTAEVNVDVNRAGLGETLLRHKQRYCRVLVM